jgi:RNA polymerase-binding transcription factor DksA
MSARDLQLDRLDVDDYKGRLLSLAQELVERLGREVETARSVEVDQPEAGDLARVDELKEGYFALAQTDTVLLEQVRAALGRIAAGTFGRCAVDGGPIEEARLRSVPWTPFCAKHQRELEERQQLRTPSL